MKYGDWWNNRNLFLTVLEAGNFKTKVLVDSVSIHFLDGHLLLQPHVAEKMMELSGVSYKGTNLISEGSILMT